MSRKDSLFATYIKNKFVRVLKYCSNLIMQIYSSLKQRTFIHIQWMVTITKQKHLSWILEEVKNIFLDCSRFQVFFYCKDQVCLSMYLQVYIMYTKMCPVLWFFYFQVKCLLLFVLSGSFFVCIKFSNKINVFYACFASIYLYISSCIQP